MYFQRQGHRRHNTVCISPPSSPLSLLCTKTKANSFTNLVFVYWHYLGVFMLYVPPHKFEDDHMNKEDNPK